MNTNYHETVDLTMSSEYSEGAQEDSPLESLTVDVDRLSNSLTQYKQRLVESLAESENSGVLAGIRISLTTLALFGLVGLLALSLNLMLRSVNASDAHLLRANLAMAVLYFLVAISALNDLSRGRARWRSERDRLRIRTQDVAEQFAELASTRQAWVQELTRSQWTSETEKLKLQMVQLELAAKQESLELCSSSLTSLQAQFDADQARQAKLNAEIAAVNEQLHTGEQARAHSQGEQSKLDQQCATLQQEIERLRMESKLVSESLQTATDQLHVEESELKSVLDTKGNLEITCSDLKTKREELERIVGELEEAQAEFDQQQFAEKTEELKCLLTEIESNELVLLDQAKRIEDAAAGIVTRETQLAELQASIATNQREHEAISESVAALHAETIAQHRAELECCSEQKRIAIEELDKLTATRAELTLAIEAATREQAVLAERITAEKLLLAETQNQYEQSLGQLAVAGTQLIESAASQLVMAEKETVLTMALAAQEAELSRQQNCLDNLELQLCQRSSAIEELLSSESQLKARVDWWLNQTGEFERLSAAQVAAMHLTEQALTERQSQLSESQALLDDAVAEIRCKRDLLAQQEQQISALMEQMAVAESSLQTAEDALQIKEKMARDAEQQAQNLLAKAESMADQIEQRAAELQSAQQQVADLQDELQALEAMKTQYENLSNDSAALDRRLDEQRDLADALGKEVEAGRLRLDEIQQAIDADTQKMLVMSANLESLEADIASQVAGRDAIAFETEQILHGQMRVQHELQRTEDVLLAEQAKLRAMQDQLATYEYDRDALVQELAAKQVDLETIRGEIERRQDACASLLRSGMEASEQCALVNEELKVAEDQLKNVRQTEADLQSTIQRLNQSRDTLLTRTEALTAEVQEAEAIAAQWRAYLEKMKVERGHLESENSSLNRQLELIAELMQQRQNALEQLADQQSVAAQRYEQTMEETLAAELTLKSVRDAVSRDDAIHASVKFELARSETMLDDCVRQQADAEARLRETENQLASLEATLVSVKDEQQQVDDACDQAQSRLSALQDSVKELSEDETELKTRSQQLLQSIEVCEQQLIRVNSQIEQSTADRIAVDEDLKYQKEQLRECVEELGTRRTELMAAEASYAEQITLSQRLDLEQAALKDQIGGQKFEATRMEASVKDLEQQAAAAQIELNALIAQRDEVQASTAELTRQEQSQREQIAGAENRLSDLEHARRKMTRQAKRVRQSLAELTKAEEQTATRTSDLQRNVDEQLNELQLNRLSLDDMRQEQVALEATIAAQSLQSEKLAQQMDEELATIGAIESRIQSSRAAKNALEKSLSMLTSERELIVTDLKRYEADRGRAEELRASLDKNLAVQATLVQELKVLQVEKAELTESVQGMRDQLNQLIALRDEASFTVKATEESVEEVPSVVMEAEAESTVVSEVETAVETEVVSEVETEAETDIETNAETEVVTEVEVEVEMKELEESETQVGQLARNDVEEDIWATVQSMSMLGRRATGSVDASIVEQGSQVPEVQDAWAFVTARATKAT